MSNRLRSALWAAGFLLALAVVVYLLMPERGQIAYDVMRSSFRTSPDGVAALYRGIQRLGRPAAPRTTPLVDADPLRGALVVLEPTDAPSPREVGALLAWVREGGVLLYAPRFVAPILSPSTAPRPRTPPPILDSLGLALRKLPPLSEDQPGDADDQSGDAHGDRDVRWGAHPLTAGLPEPLAPARVVLHHEAASQFDAMEGDDGGAATDDEEDEGKEDEEDEETERPPIAPATTTLLGTELAMQDAELTQGGDAAPTSGPAPRPLEGAGAMEVALGEGRILIFADARPLSNGQAAADPLAALAVRAAIAYTAPGDTVFFDEFHHGVHGLGSPTEAVAGFFFGSPRGHALFHLGVVAFLAVAVAGVRFGAPADPPRDERRSPLEHVSALGTLYRRAEARETAVLLLLSRLARWAHVSPPRNLDEARALLDGLAHRGADPGPSPSPDASPGPSPRDGDGDGPSDGARHPLRRIRDALDATPPELTAIAAGIDDLTGSSRPTHHQRRSRT